MMTIPPLPPEHTDPWYLPLLEGWEAIRARLNGDLKPGLDLEAAAEQAEAAAQAALASAQAAEDAANQSPIPDDYVRSVMILGGNEERPDAELVIWLDPSNLGALNAISTDLLFTMTAAPPDVAPPSVPTGLVVSAITQSSFTLKWAASTDNKAVTGYRYRLNGAAPVAIGTSTTLVLTDLSPNTPYTIDLAAGDAAGNWSAYSTPASTSTNPISVPTPWGAWGFSQAAPGPFPSSSVQAPTGPVVQSTSASAGLITKAQDSHGNATGAITAVAAALIEWEVPAGGPALGLDATGWTLMWNHKHVSGSGGTLLTFGSSWTVSGNLLRFNAGGSYSTDIPITSIGSNNWGNIAVTWSPVTKLMTSYVNGVAVLQVTRDMASIFASTSRITGRLKTSSSTAFVIDDLRLWRQPLEAATIAAIHPDSVPA